MEYLNRKEAGKTSLTHPDAAFIELPNPLFPVLQRIIVEPLNENAIVPTYASEGDAGADLYAPEDIIIEPGEKKLIKLGFSMEIPVHPFHDWGFRWEAQVRPRSGTSLKTDLSIANSPGTIDNFYRDEVGVILHNGTQEALELDRDDEDPTYYTLDQVYVYHVLDLKGNIVKTDDLHKVGTYLIHKGERFAQLVFNQVNRPMEGFVVGKVSKDIDRKGGFGSSGTK